MKTPTIIWIVVIVLVLGGAWYWYSSMQAPGPSSAAGTNGSPNQDNLGGPSGDTPQTPPDSSSTGDGSTVGQNLILGIQPDATLGDHLSAFNGMTLYTYASDSAGVSTCTGSCATTWPPYTVPSAGDIHVPANITGNVSTITRADGTLQVTYNGMPLYFYAKDTKPGDATGQGVGGVWFVAKP